MNTKIKLEDIKEYFINLAGGNSKKVQIENITINEINFVDNTKECIQATFAYEAFSFVANFVTTIGILCAAYLVAFI